MPMNFNLDGWEANSGRSEDTRVRRAFCFFEFLLGRKHVLLRNFASTAYPGTMLISRQERKYQKLTY